MIAAHTVRMRRPVDAVDADHVEVQVVIDRWLASLGSANTRAAYRLDIATYLRWCDGRGAGPLPGDTADTLHLVEEFRVDPQLAAGAAAVARRVAALRAFLRFAAPTVDARSDAIPADRRTGPEPSVATGTRTRSTATSSPTVPLDAHERTHLLDTLAAQPSAAQVLVAMLLLDGLKLDEVLRLDAAGLHGRPPAVHVVVPRVDPHRVALHPTTAAVVTRHLAGRRDGPLLTSASRREPPGSRLTRHGADYLVRRAGVGAGLSAPLTSNVLRRTYAAHAHAEGRSLRDIALRMGHDDPRSTRRYLSPHPGAGTVAPIPHTTGGVGSRRRASSQEV